MDENMQALLGMLGGTVGALAADRSKAAVREGYHAAADLMEVARAANELALGDLAVLCAPLDTQQNRLNEKAEAFIVIRDRALALVEQLLVPPVGIRMVTPEETAELRAQFQRESAPHEFVGPDHADNCTACGLGRDDLLHHQDPPDPTLITPENVHDVIAEIESAKDK